MCKYRECVSAAFTYTKYFFRSKLWFVIQLFKINSLTQNFQYKYFSTVFHSILYIFCQRDLIYNCDSRMYAKTIVGRKQEFMKSAARK